MDTPTEMPVSDFSYVAPYLLQRREALKGVSVKNLTVRGAPYTSTHPHTCAHCNEITVDLRVSLAVQATDKTLRQAINAARSGCVLFQVWVDMVAVSSWLEGNIVPKDLNVFFTIEYNKEDLPYAPAMLALGASRSATEKLTLGASSHLFLWSKENDPSATDITTRPYELDYASPASIGFSRYCIETCRSEHAECRRPSDSSPDNGKAELIPPDAIPTRLLELCRDGRTLLFRLVGKNSTTEIDKDHVSCEGYASLSYCWGGSQPVQLTWGSLEQLCGWQRSSLLPKSMEDAIWYTERIGLKYVWVDALCLFQDDPADKSREIARMALYYGQSTVTLCAASAPTCLEGFLHRRLEDPSNYAIGPVQIGVLNSSGLPGLVQALSDPDYTGSRRPREPTTLRGWTLQEGLLSRRLLIFAASHLSFSCSVANASCGGPEPRVRPRQMTSYESRVNGIYTLSALRNYPILEVWHRVVREYTSRFLGFTDDKLPAVSALASSLVSMARERDQDMAYLAGVMLDTTQPDNCEWRHMLLWTAAKTTKMRSIPGRSPSWSWAALDGPVMTWGHSQYSNWVVNDGIRLIRYNVDLENNNLPFGVVKGGLITLRAKTRRLDTIQDANIKVSLERVYVNERMDEEKTVLVYSPDTTAHEQLIRANMRGEERGLLLLELIPFYNKQTSPAGIIITREDRAGDERYVRIGMFEYQPVDYIRPLPVETPSERQARKSLFEDCRFRDLLLV
ncbi:HET-domain-containing protein [Xylariomycetidae sp. FL2044]|nr:HET-domain-containing protein [Xylariomycetidae sp. FL2044]